MANSDIIKIGFDYRASLAQFEKDTNGVFDGISTKAGKQKIIIQLDAKDDKVIDKIKELQKLKLDKFTFEFGDSGLKEQLQTFDKLENKINEIISLSKGIDLSFNTKNKTEAYNQLKKYADAFKDYYGNEEAMATNAGAKAGYAYYKAYEEALRKGVAQSKLEKVTVDFDVNDSIFSKESIVKNRIKEFENFQKYGKADESNLIAEITLLENRLLKFNSAYSQVKANLGDAPITPEITKNIEEYVRLLEVAESRAKDVELFGYSSEDINSDKDLANMYLDFAKEDATAENKKYIESLKEEEIQAVATAEAEQKLAEAQKETVSNTSNSNNSQIEELKSNIQEVKTELGDVKDRISSIESNGFENVREDVEKTKESVKELNSELTEMKSNLSSTSQETNISSGTKDAFPDSSTNTKPETEGMEQVEKATEEAIQAKKDFATANEGVQSSIDGSENPLKLEAELMEQIAKSAREAADAKKEFVEANKQVKASADDSYSENKKKDKYAKHNKISEDDFLNNSNKYSSIANEKLSNSGYTILGETVNSDLIDGLVKVSAKIKDINGNWKTFTARIDADGNMFSQRFRAITKGVNNLNNELANFGKDKIKIPETDEQVQKFKELNTAIDDYASVRKRIENGKAFEKDKEDSQNLLKLINEIMGKADGSATILSSKQLSDAQNKLDKIDKTISEIQQKNVQKINDNLLKIQNDATEKLSKYTDSSKYTPEFIERVNSKIGEIEQLNITKPEDVARLKTIDGKIQKIVDNSKLLENKLVKQKSKIADIISQMKIYRSENTNMSSSQKSSLNSIISSAEKLAHSGKDTAEQIEQIKIAFSGLKAEISETGKTGKNFFSQIRNRLTDMNSKFVAQFLSWQDWIRYIQQGINTVRELDEAMTEVRKVSEATESQYASFQRTIASTAKEIASTNKELLNSSADFLRLGYNLEQAEDLAKNATLFVNVGDGVDTTAATEDMITAMKAFDIKAEESIKIVDDYNQIGNKFALSATDIGEAMKRSASALETGNNSFEQSIALITAMNEIVQNSENTGNTLKVFSLRLRGAKAELESMGEDTDGLCESTSKLREQIKALTGVDIMINDNTFKSTTDIVKELGKVWENLSDSSQAATLELVAGKTRANNVAALLKNYEQIDEVLKSLGDAEGSAERENEAIIESINGRIKILSATAEEFWQTFLDTDTIKNAVTLGTDLLNLLTKIIDNLGLLPTILTGISAALSFKNVGIDTLVAY